MIKEMIARLEFDTWGMNRGVEKLVILFMYCILSDIYGKMVV